MKQLPENLILQKNKVSTSSAWLVLLDITLNDTNNTTFRLVKNNEPIGLVTSDYVAAQCTAHWKFDDNASDSSGNGKTLTVSGATYVSGKLGNGLSFDGVNDFASVASGPSLNVGTNDFSLSFWMKANNAFTTFPSPNLLQKRATYLGYHIEMDNAGRLGIYINDTNDTAYYYARTVKGYNDNTFHHVAVVVDRDSSLTVFIDGVSAPFTVTSSAKLIDVQGSLDNSQMFRVSGASDTTDLFCGIIDEVMLFKKALSAQEVAVLYNGGAGTNKPTLHYKAFNFDLETIASDGKGTIPAVDLKVSSISFLLQPYLLRLQGGVGSVVKITVVNSAYLAEDYSELELLFSVTSTSTSREYITFRLGAINPIMQRFPRNRYIALHCRHKFRQAICGYAGQTIESITLSGADPVAIGITGHGFKTGDSILLETCNGIAGGLEGIWTITKTNDNSFTLDTTVSSNYTGNYTSGGKAGYAGCDRTLTQCRQRGNSARFGGFCGMRSKSMRLV